MCSGLECTELPDVFSGAFIKCSWRMRWVEHVTDMGDMRNVYKILVRNLETKRLLETWA
jgi:hypothetical protein